MPESMKPLDCIVQAELIEDPFDRGEAAIRMTISHSHGDHDHDHGHDDMITKATPMRTMITTTITMTTMSMTTSTTTTSTRPSTIDDTAGHAEHR